MLTNFEELADLLRMRRFQYLAVTHVEESVMPADQNAPDVQIELLRVHARGAPLCYLRQATLDEIDQVRADAQSSRTLMLVSAVTCAGFFLVVYGGWQL